MENEWIWAVALCALPFVAFGAIELLASLRRRRLKSIAQRPKGRPAAGQAASKGAIGRS